MHEFFFENLRNPARNRRAGLMHQFRSGQLDSRNLLIVSLVTSTPGCTANFPGNWYSHPLILRTFGRSGQKLAVEYHGWTTSDQFFGVLIKKGYRQGPGSGNLGESLVKATISQRQYWYQNHRKITYKKNQLFICLPPACFETGFGFVSGFEEG